MMNCVGVERGESLFVIVVQQGGRTTEKAEKRKVVLPKPTVYIAVCG